MSTGFIFRFEGDKLLQPFLIPQSLFTPQLQGDPAARELRRQQELEASHMLLENIEKARVRCRMPCRITRPCRVC